VVVALRMLARPLPMCCSPHAMAIQGTTEFVTAMIANEPTRLRHPGPNRGLPLSRMINASAKKPVSERSRRSTSGLMYATATLIARNEPPQINARVIKAAYGKKRLRDSDTGRPFVGGEH
jgi:hypothetical protein